MAITCPFITTSLFCRPRSNGSIRVSPRFPTRPDEDLPHWIGDVFPIGVQVILQADRNDTQVRYLEKKRKR